MHHTRILCLVWRSRVNPFLQHPPSPRLIHPEESLTGPQGPLFTEGALYHVLVVIQVKNIPSGCPGISPHTHHLSLAWVWLLSKVSCLRDTTRLTCRVIRVLGLVPLRGASMN